jgi:hypothetical protein
MNEHVQNVKPVPPIARPQRPAHVIRSDTEAIKVAESLAAEFVQRSSLRDRERQWPVQELDAFSQSGLWSLNVPICSRRSWRTALRGIRSVSMGARRCSRGDDRGPLRRSLGTHQVCRSGRASG